MSRTISFYTLGCRSNQSETSTLKNVFVKKGFRIVSSGQPSDIVVINTCTVTDKVDKESIKIVSKVNRMNPRSKIAMIGCQAQTQTDRLKKLPNVHWIVGTAEKINLADHIEHNLDTPSTIIINPPIIAKNFLMPTDGADVTHKRANLKIQEGCDSFCSFCEVPYARGPARSRDFNDLLSEAKRLVALGYKEIVLTGTNIGMYKDHHKTLTDVVRHLEDIPLLQRIRISSIEPNVIPDDILLLMGTKTKLCRHLHMSLQSGCDDILKAMGRNYTQKKINLFFEFAINNVPQLCLGADIIAGFPGETTTFFDETYQFLKESPLAYFHVFSYSKRNLAKSRLLPYRNNARIIRHRSQRLRELNQEKKRTFLNQFIGSTQKVLFESRKNDLWTGLTDHYVRVHVPSNEDLTNHIKVVRIIKNQGMNLEGEIIS